MEYVYISSLDLKKENYHIYIAYIYTSLYITYIVQNNEGNN